MPYDPMISYSLCQKHCCALGAKLEVKKNQGWIRSYCPTVDMKKMHHISAPTPQIVKPVHDFMPVANFTRCQLSSRKVLQTPSIRQWMMHGRLLVVQMKNLVQGYLTAKAPWMPLWAHMLKPADPINCFSYLVKQTCSIDNIKLWPSRTTYGFIRRFCKLSGVRRWCHCFWMSKVIQALSERVA